VTISSPLRGQENVQQVFTLDYRNNEDPVFDGEGVLFKFVGELFYQGKGCSTFGPIDFPHLMLEDSYFALSPQAFNCIAEQVAKTPLGQFSMNRRSLAALFNDDQKHDLTTSTLKTKIPIFEQKLGANKPLDFKIGYRDMTFKFNREGYNFRIECLMTMSVFYDFADEEHMHMNLPKTELLYDEIPFLIEGTWWNDEQGQAFIHLSRWQLDHHIGSKHMPHRTQMDLTSNEYLEFLSNLSIQLHEDRLYLNYQMHDGITYPF